MLPRMHPDLYTDDHVGEVKCLLALGATAVQWDKRTPDADSVILTDPEATASALWARPSGRFARCTQASSATTQP